MTYKENITLQDLALKLEQYIEADNEWKAKVEEQLKPLTEDRVDRLIVQKYGVLAFKIAVAILGLLISIFVLFKYVADFIKR